MSANISVITMGTFMKKMLVFLSIFSALSVSAKTIEIKDAEEAIEIYGLLGAAQICEDSEKLTLEQQVEIAQIKSHYNYLRTKNGLPVSTEIMHEASSEKFGIKPYTDPTYRDCSSALQP